MKDLFSAPNDVIIIIIIIITILLLRSIIKHTEEPPRYYRARDFFPEEKLKIFVLLVSQWSL
jgi:hypothetical protein